MPTIPETVSMHSRDLTKLLRTTVPALEARIAELERRLNVAQQNSAGVARAPAAIDPLVLGETDAEFEDLEAPGGDS